MEKLSAHPFEETGPTDRQLRTMLMIYQRLDDDVHDWQVRQYQAVYYAVLLLGLLLVFAQRIGAATTSWLIALVLLLALSFIWNLQHATHRARRGIKRIRRSELYRDLFEPLEELPENYDKWEYDRLPTATFWLVLLAAAIICWVVVGDAYFVLKLVGVVVIVAAIACCSYDRGTGDEASEPPGETR